MAYSNPEDPNVTPFLLIVLANIQGHDTGIVSERKRLYLDTPDQSICNLGARISNAEFIA